MLINGLAWCGLLVDYCDVLSAVWSHSDGTHSLQRIHWCCYFGFLHICSDEETNSSTSWMAWRWVHFKQFFGENYSFNYGLEGQNKMLPNVKCVWPLADTLGECQFSVLPLPLSFARSRESKGCLNSRFDQGVGLSGRGRYPLKPRIFANLLETKGYPEHTAARSSREYSRLK